MSKGRLTVYLDMELLEALSSLAKKEHRTLSGQITHILVPYFEEREAKGQSPYPAYLGLGTKAGEEVA